LGTVSRLDRRGVGEQTNARGGGNRTQKVSTAWSILPPFLTRHQSSFIGMP
jgi:hypothetical protein